MTRFQVRVNIEEIFVYQIKNDRHYVFALVHKKIIFIKKELRVPPNSYRNCSFSVKYIFQFIKTDNAATQ